MRKLLSILAAAGLTVGAVAAVPHQAAAQTLTVHWGYGSSYYAPPPPPPPPPYWARPHHWRYGPPPWAYAPPPPPRPWWWR